MARELDLTDTALRRWVHQVEIDAGGRQGLTTDDLDELRRLRAENRTLKMERDLLKNAAAFFATESDRTP